MGLTRKLGLALTLALCAAAPATGTGATPAGWDRMKSLVGAWKGTDNGNPVPSRTALVSDGTALMETLDGDHDVTMVTMYAPDGAGDARHALLRRGKSAAHARDRLARWQEPRFRVRGRVERGRHVGEVMRRLVVTFVDADHFQQTWTSRAADGKEHSSVFEYTRVK